MVERGQPRGRRAPSAAAATSPLARRASHHRRAPAGSPAAGAARRFGESSSHSRFWIGRSSPAWKSALIRAYAAWLSGAATAGKRTRFTLHARLPDPTVCSLENVRFAAASSSAAEGEDSRLRASEGPRCTIARIVGLRHRTAQAMRSTRQPVLRSRRGLPIGLPIVCQYRLLSCLWPCRTSVILCS